MATIDVILLTNLEHGIPASIEEELNGAIKEAILRKPAKHEYQVNRLTVHHTYEGAGE